MTNKKREHFNGGFWDNIKPTYIHIIEVSGKEERRGLENVFGEMMAEQISQEMHREYQRK